MNPDRHDVRIVTPAEPSSRVLAAAHTAHYLQTRVLGWGGPARATPLGDRREDQRAQGSDVRYPLHDRPRRRARTDLEGGTVRKRAGMDGAGAAFARNQARPACNLTA